MGQNQEKLEEGEQALCEGLEEQRPYPDSGGASSHAADVMEGGSFSMEEAANNKENSWEPDTQDLDRSPCQEPTTPSTEEHINLWVSPFAPREVRQGGAVGKEGGGGGDGGRTTPVVLLETDMNQESSGQIEERVRAYKLSQITIEEKKTEEAHQASSKMEYRDEETVPCEKPHKGISHEKHGSVTSGNVNSFDNNEDGSASKRISKCGSLPGESEFLSVQHQNETEVANEDIKLCAGTAGSLSERKEPPPAQPQHPLKNSLEKESLLDMSDTIHHTPPNEGAENNTKEEMRAVSNEHLSKRPKAIYADIQMESGSPDLHMKTTGENTHEEIDSDSTLNPVLPIEPSSILEKLLRKNRKETSPDISKIKEARDSTDFQMEINAKKTFDTTATGVCGERTDHSEFVESPSPGSKKSPSKANRATKDHHIKEISMKQTDTADIVGLDGLYFQPRVSGGNVCENTLTKSHYSTAGCENPEESIHSTDASVKEKMELNPKVFPSKTLSSDNIPSVISHQIKSCEVSGVIAVESAPTSESEVKDPLTRMDGKLKDSYHSVTGGKPDVSTVRPPLLKQNDSDGQAGPQLVCSEDSGSESVKRKKVKDSPEDTAAPAVNAGLALALGGTVTAEEIHQVTTSKKQDFHTENTLPGQSDKNPSKENDDHVLKRDKSQSTPKSRPVSELIRETIQLHEKLQHQDRPKPAEVKSEEQGQSVKVAQMKAAFDSAQKSPDKAIERKPSVRKGKSISI